MGGEGVEDDRRDKARVCQHQQPVYVVNQQAVGRASLCVVACFVVCVGFVAMFAANTFVAPSPRTGLRTQIRTHVSRAQLSLTLCVST